jgi:hypothetical protein
MTYAQAIHVESLQMTKDACLRVWHAGVYWWLHPQNWAYCSWDGWTGPARVLVQWSKRCCALCFALDFVCLFWSSLLTGREQRKRVSHVDWPLACSFFVGWNFLIILQPAVRVRQSASLSTLIVFQIWQRPVLSFFQVERKPCVQSKAQNLSKNILTAYLSTPCVPKSMFQQDHSAQSAHSASIIPEPNSWP